ncbi:hypothetical protein MIMGU_mgv1a022735mg [Erythranthe guttata]|uniref:RING-type domain-containing protein n=1 Tax=Erythranthe guttata TaxID=4155 RepID=A0A022RVD0_ERYGU|nr:PREDICTED: putative RING-H2 finger protein ATL69 [Erythranthe guttata]EYU42915.1 hypothetical protein MIMGU_mgv1a022735mg [Erythranthe guttata]|eukprot:XP_012830635.1 PREDICTED: putative RING-H2 finger protein ATL69 [Erythranthe guttata]
MSSISAPNSINCVSLGYGIAVAVSVFLLIFIIVLASYICVRFKTCSDGEEEEGRDGLGQFQEPVIKIVLGLEKPVIETYPVIELGRSRRLPRPNNGPCSICLSDYCVKEKIRCLPECNHCFHARCIDEWLLVNGSCPLCRNSPAVTPLSKFVPLANYHSR